MYSVHQENLFTLEDLLELSPQDTYAFFFKTLDIRPFLKVVSKKFVLGAPTQLNYTAMLRSLFIRVIERIPTIKDLRKRLKHSVEFNFNCGFTGSDRIPSEATYSRLIQKLQGSAVFEQTQETLVRLAFQEGFLDASTVAMDATHVESRDRQPEKKKADAEELPTEVPKKKRGRKFKAEREKWLQEQLEMEANRPLFEKKVEEQLPCTFTELREQIPLAAEWGVKKNSAGKNVFWYGFKAHLLVDCKSQYILTALLSSGSINDGKMAIPLLKALAEHHPDLAVKQVLADAGYDLAPIYKQVESMGAQALIDYNRRNESLLKGKISTSVPFAKRATATGTIASMPNTIRLSIHSLKSVTVARLTMRLAKRFSKLKGIRTPENTRFRQEEAMVTTISTKSEQPLNASMPISRSTFN